MSSMSKEAVAEAPKATDMTKEEFKQVVLEDYKLANVSRETSLLGRREVLTGKAKFGIFGDGKEVPQLAMAKFFEDGDFRSGYYRDQTFMMAIGQTDVQKFFAQLYAHPNVAAEPASGGRSMNGHYATRSLDENGHWLSLKNQKNSSSDISPTAGQMPRLLGLAQASKVYRHNKEIPADNLFSRNGNEVAFGTIGDASTSEGLFWETINAAGVLQVPMVMSVWDDGHGISVPKKYQTTKSSISEVLKGFQRDEGEKNGYEIFKVKGWDYPALVATYEKAVNLAREEHIPVLIHVEDLTQPQGHSTSGSHERYKSKERLQWEVDFDCIRKMGEWMVETGIATTEELETIKKEAKNEVRRSQKAAWDDFTGEIKSERKEALVFLNELVGESSVSSSIKPMIDALKNDPNPNRKDLLNTVRKTIRICRNDDSTAKTSLINWYQQAQKENSKRYSDNLYSNSALSPLNIEEVAVEYDESAEEVDGRVVLRENFDKIFSKYPEVLIFGEDSGKIGDVNQGLEGLQNKYGELRVSDTGIREATIAGQGIGMALRGLRPIAEIQYLDYLLYCLQIMSDDLATVQYRTNGKQKAPLIVRTRGHRLEGIWHSGSPMGGIIHLLRGMHVLVPRNMTKAAGFYNTLLETDEPALVVECLNGYRLKEKMPNNLSEIRTPIGVVETLKEGSDITLVSYGSTLRLVEDAAKELLQAGIDAEVIDVQSLLPLDINHDIVKSLKKTNRLLVIDEDVPGGAASYILNNIIEDQEGYKFLDSKPQTLTAKAHRPPYGTDGDYFSKPSVEDIYETVYAIMHETDPKKFPKLI